MYCPSSFAVSYAEYLMGTSALIKDDFLEYAVYEVMKTIRNDLMRDPSISWFKPLVDSGCWVDVTSNKALTSK